MDPASLDLKDAYDAIKVTPLFTDLSVHETVKTLLTHCEWFMADYLQVKLTVNLWNILDQELHVCYQFERSIMQEQYYLNSIYTNFHNLSVKIYEDVKKLLAQINITNVPKCNHCFVRYEQWICPLYSLFFALSQ